MTHKAIIKANRLDVEWCYVDRKDDIYYNKSMSDSSYFGYRYEREWERLLKKGYMNTRNYHTGSFTIEEKEINSDILQQGHYIYVSEFDSYCEIVKVEVSDNGNVNYYIDEAKEFYDITEESRLKSIDEWLKVEYPNVINFADLIKHKDDRCQFKVEWEEYWDDKLKEIKSIEDKYKKEESNAVSNIELTKKRDDSAEEVFGIVAMIGIIALTATLVLLANFL